MKTVLIYPDILQQAGWRGYYYEGLASLAGALDAAGHEPCLIHMVRDEPDMLVRRIREAVGGQRALVAYSTTSTQAHYLRRWAPRVREETGLPAVVGGVHVTLDPAGALAELPAVDWGCCGDGEEVLVRLVDTLEQGGTPAPGGGLWARDPEGRVVEGGVADPVDLQALAPPKRDIFDLPSIQGGDQGFLSAMGSRGCPYSCTYCCNKALRQTYREKGCYLRQKRPDSFVQELREAVRTYPGTVQGFFFEDDIFGLHLEWLEGFIARYLEGPALPFGCNLRPEMVRPELVDLLQRGGCKRVHIGLESGDARIRREVLGRATDDDRIRLACRTLRQAGMEILTYNLIGLPEERPRSILRTIRFNAELAPDHCQHSIFYPFPGTALHARVVAEGWLGPREIQDYFVDTCLDLPGLSRSWILFFNAAFDPLLRWYTRLGKMPGLVRRPLGFLTAALVLLPFTPAVTRALGFWKCPGKGR